MNQVYVTMLGRFDITVGNQSALYQLGNSTKSVMLLQYLLLNPNKPVPINELLDLFWSQPEKSTNPENALKTMISRMRANLAKISPALQNCIVSEKKSYMWNPQIECQVDVFEFEKIAAQLNHIDALHIDTVDQFMYILNLYAGDLFAPSSTEQTWLASRSLYFHHLYVRTMCHFVNLLKQSADYNTIIHVCRTALDIDAFDDTLNYELMNALKEIGHNSAALQQYRHITGMYQQYLGIEPSETILNFYKNMVKSDLSAEVDIMAIHHDLKNSGSLDPGPFVCDYSIFKDIYHIQLRSLDRNDRKMFLALLTMTQMLEQSQDLLVLDTLMRELLHSIKQCLRKGDTVSRYSPSQFAILLPMRDFSNGHAVISRIKKTFFRNCTFNNIKIGFQLDQLD